MPRSTLVIPQLDTIALAFDLGNSLMSISGISHVDVDETSCTVTVDYDSEYLSEGVFKDFVKGAGYPSQGDESPS